MATTKANAKTTTTTTPTTKTKTKPKPKKRICMTSRKRQKFPCVNIGVAQKIAQVPSHENDNGNPGPPTVTILYKWKGG